MRIDKTKLRISMLKAGIATARELSKKSGVNMNTLSAITNGKTCRADTVMRLASALGLEMQEIVREEDQ